jgi:hypothetical protein
MILLYRISSFGIAIVSALGFLLFFAQWINPGIVIILTVVLTALILARLLGWSIQTFQFWHLLGTPMLFLLSSFGPFFLLENFYSKVGLAVVVVLLLFFFVENVFSFTHLPINYQPFTLEYLSQLLHILSVFFVAVFGFGLSLFLQTPLWLLSLVFFLILFFIVYSTLWAGKVDPVSARPFAFAGALLITELFTVLTFLPVGFYTNAAFLALGVYVFLGVSRAHAHHKLSKQILRRYGLIFILLTVVITITSQWV